MTYDRRFFASIREGSRRSAAAVVPVFLDAHPYPVESVVDIGCGEGLWGAAFRDAGCDVIGFDGGDLGEAQIVVERVDLTQPLGDRGGVDLAVCLEVAEHLPAKRAEGLVADLCALSDAVLFSAAIPGQGGTGHLNERWPDYWTELFKANGFVCGDDLRWRIWDDPAVEWWYRQNIFVAVKPPLEAPGGEPRRVVHPDAWRHHGHR